MRARRRVVAALLAAGLAGAGADPAAATWSVIGVDPATGEVGVAVASCVPDPVTPVAVLVPGRGAAANQAEENMSAGPVLVQGLMAGAAAEAVLGPLIEDDPYGSLRQYGYVSITGGAGAHTGADVPAEALEARSGDGTAAVQGNTLASPAVVTDALAAYEVTTGALSDRLLAALVAGAAAGGDARCGEQRASAAALAVARPGDAPWVVTDESQELSALPVPSLLISEVSDSADATALLVAAYGQRPRAAARGGADTAVPDLALGLTGGPGGGAAAAPPSATADAAGSSGTTGSTTQSGAPLRADGTAPTTGSPVLHLAVLAIVTAVAAGAAAAWAARRRPE